jgi:integrase
LAVNRKVAASTQNQALSALVFLYREVLKIQLGDFGDIVWAKRPSKLPVVFTREEVKQILLQLGGTSWLLGQILYGACLRVMKCVRLRVKDIDFGDGQIVVRDGKGNKDRATMLPEIITEGLRRQLLKAKKIHKMDLKAGFGAVYLLFTLERKYKNANRSWAWQYAFPAVRRSIDPRSGIERRHHLSETVPQRAVKKPFDKVVSPRPAVVTFCATALPRI